MPMLTIGMLLGIPEEDQVAIRDRIDAGLRIDGRHRGAVGRDRRSRASSCSATTSTGGRSTRPTT